MGPAEVTAALDATLKVTGLTYLDGYVIHWPVPLRHVGVEGPSAGVIWPVTESGEVLYAEESVDSDPLLAAWRSLEAAFDAGKARTIGVSNTPSSLLRPLLARARVRPHVHQFEAHPHFPNNGAFVLFCVFQILAASSSPLVIYTNSVRPLPTVPSPTAPYTRHPRQASFALRCVTELYQLRTPPSAGPGSMATALSRPIPSCSWRAPG